MENEKYRVLPEIGKLAKLIFLYDLIEKYGCEELITRAAVGGYLEGKDGPGKAYALISKWETFSLDWQRKMALSVDPIITHGLKLWENSSSCICILDKVYTAGMLFGWGYSFQEALKIADSFECEQWYWYDGKWHPAPKPEPIPEPYQPYIPYWDYDYIPTPYIPYKPHYKPTPYKPYKPHHKPTPYKPYTPYWDDDHKPDYEPHHKPDNHKYL